MAASTDPGVSGRAPSAANVTPTRRTRGLGRFLDAILAAGVLAAVDGTLFHAGVYVRWLKPQSYSGRVEASARRLSWSLAHHPGMRHVVLMGDSTTAHGMLEQVLDRHLAAAGLSRRTINIAEGGSTSNAWLPLLKSLPIDRATTDTVVLGIFVPTLAEVREPRPDAEIAKTRMSVTDGVRLAAAYPGVERRMQIVSGSFFRLPWFREDVRDLLSDPRERRKQLARQAESERVTIRSPRRTPPARSLRSVAIGTDGALAFDAAEPWIKKNMEIRKMLKQRFGWQQAVRQRALRQPPVDHAYLRSLDALVRLLHDRGVGVVWAVVPESPYPTGWHHHRELAALRRRLAGDGIDVALFQDADLLGLLEQPLYYGDAMHLNEAGAELYSEGLGRFLVSRLRGEPLDSDKPLFASRR